MLPQNTYLTQQHTADTITHRPKDTKDDLERGLVKEAVERVGTYELLQICLPLEPTDVPSPCPTSRVGVCTGSENEKNENRGAGTSAERIYM